MEIEEWKEKVIGCLQKHQDATFALLTREMGEEGKGWAELLFPKSRDLVLWCGMDYDLALALSGLYEDRLISYRPCGEDAYRRDGAVLTMPVAYEPKDYHVDHWYPAIIAWHGAGAWRKKEGRQEAPLM